MSITDVVQLEATTNTSYAKDALIQNAIDSGQISVVDTQLGQAIKSGNASLFTNAGEVSIAQAFNDPANASASYQILSDDSGTFTAKGANDYTGPVDSSGTGNIWDYYGIDQNSVKGTPDVVQMMTGSGQAEEVADPQTNSMSFVPEDSPVPSGDFVIDPSKFSAPPVGSDPAVDAGSAAGTFESVATSAGVSDVALAGIEGLGTLVSAGGAALLAYGAYTAGSQAIGQAEAGDYAGAAQTIGNFAAAAGAGLEGAEVGGAAGGEIGGELGSIAGPRGRPSGPLLELWQVPCLGHTKVLKARVS